MGDRISEFALGGTLLFASLTAAALSAGWFTAILATIIIVCAMLFCVAAIAEANAETEPRPIADDVRRVKIKEGSRKVRRTFWEEGVVAGKGADPAEQAGQAKRRDATWVKKYFDGEFDPKDDPEEKMELSSNAASAHTSRLRKIII